ncbi:transmembrane channel-like protein 1 isoform X2 [Venturia canescens]|uniref:transmembrane channel-like protein 1 isoform X2 n=1 Tax=Venturia canescens TaxID=32260 RepID=UPI001C9C37C7|nr:transmembrane channel-like protein 1 isoform X2 [Venturia canescens]
MLLFRFCASRRHIEVRVRRRIKRTSSDGAEKDEDDDDYSASISAIIQRRNSIRKSRRRNHARATSVVAEDDAYNFGVSPIMRRTSSVFTTSSGETAISMEEQRGSRGEEEDQQFGQLRESGAQEEIFENLKLHKEVISSIKLQPWKLGRKMKLVRRAKNYVTRHEGVLQERLAQSKNTRDAVARLSIFINKKWQYLRRELMNLETWMVPWELRIKEIESHFGSAVASYFIFLRWLFWINLVVSFVLTAFVAIPEVLMANPEEAGERKFMLPEEKVKSKHLLTLWEFEGVVKYSPFFYGWYTNQVSNRSVYKLPLAYFLANLIVYAYSFVAILRKMAENSRMSKLSEKEDECAFSWKLFTGWDFMIGNPETAHNRIAGIVLGFKESLLEEAEKEKKLGHWKIIAARIIVNLSVISLLVASAYAVVQVVARSTESDAESGGWWRQNEITIVMSLISYIFPLFFEILGIFENYHPRKQLRLQLARIMLLNLLNLYSLIFALFDKISSMDVELKSLKPTIESSSTRSFPSPPPPDSNFIKTKCEKVGVPCQESIYRYYGALASMSLLFMSNVSSLNETTSSLRYYDSSGINNDNETLAREIASKSSIYSADESAAIPGTPSMKVTSDELPPSPPLLNFQSSWSLDENYLGSVEEKNKNMNYVDYDSLNYPDSSEYDATSFTDVFNETSGRIETTIATTVSDSSTGQALPNDAISQTHTEIIRCYEIICNGCDSASSQTQRNNKYEEKYQGTGAASLPPLKLLDMKTRKKLRRLCWETMFGQELAKLTVMDLVLTIIATLGVDFLRALFIRFMNSWWCWDLEKQFPQYGDFKIAENILHLVNNQGLVWMGMFFSPGLTVLNLAKLGILMYLRSWAVLTCNVPHEVVFRASRSNNFYLALLLTMLFLCVLPVGYAIVWVEPSWHCGPFSGYPRIYHLATESLRNALPGETLHKCLDYIASPGIVIPLIVLMALIIYYMLSLASSLREANDDLKIQLRQERTEERRKMFRIAEKRGQLREAPFAKWKKILPVLASHEKSSETPVSKAISSFFDLKNRREARIRSINSEVDEATDDEQHFSLPHDPGAYSRERANSDMPGKKHACFNDDDRGTIPKIRVDTTGAPNQSNRQRSLEETTFRSDTTT